ncbi:hypothetical protein [Achromobacter animicus]|uniref:hypothetical protein n=1 Tax=Achromobacter animicus TaxID=1389935 RepID=UPI0028B218AA|nr:hypothetical protein [Achromobacter animicus]
MPETLKAFNAFRKTNQRSVFALGANHGSGTFRRLARKKSNNRGFAGGGGLILAGVSLVRIIGAAHISGFRIKQRDDPCEFTWRKLPDLQGGARAGTEFLRHLAASSVYR